MATDPWALAWPPESHAPVWYTTTHTHGLHTAGSYCCFILQGKKLRPKGATMLAHSHSEMITVVTADTHSFG